MAEGNEFSYNNSTATESQQQITAARKASTNDPLAGNDDDPQRKRSDADISDLQYSEIENRAATGAPVESEAIGGISLGDASAATTDLALSARKLSSSSSAEGGRSDDQPPDAEAGPDPAKGGESGPSSVRLRQGGSGQLSAESRQLTKEDESGAGSDAVVGSRVCELPDTLVNQVKTLFADLAKNGEEVLRMDQVETLLTNMGYAVSRDFIEEAFLDHDARFDGGLTVTSLLRVVEDIVMNTKQKQRLLDAFRILDVDNTGLIDLAFLRPLLCADPAAEDAVFNGGEAPLSEAEFTHFMAEARATPDGRLDYRQFVQKFLFKDPVEPVAKPVKQRRGKPTDKKKKA